MDGIDAYGTEVIRHGDALVVQVAGDVDLGTAPWFENKLRGCMSERPSSLVVDMSGVRFCSSAGLAVLYFVQAREDGMRFVVVPSSAVRRTMELSGLTEVITTVESVDEALMTSRQDEGDGNAFEQP